MLADATVKVLGPAWLYTSTGVPVWKSVSFTWSTRMFVLKVQKSPMRRPRPTCPFSRSSLYCG